MTKLAGSHVAITGGSEGIGLAVATLCVSEGAKVSLIARRSEVLEAAAEQLRALGGNVAIASADVSDEAATQAALDAVVRDNGPVDVLVAAAGYAIPGYVENQPVSEFRREMEVNYLGTVHAVKAVLEPMIQARRGHIVVVSSTAGLLGVFGYTAYCPTKYAVRGFADALRAEVRSCDVNVSIVYPPDTDTPGFAAENVHKPFETAAVSGSIKPLSAEVVAQRIVSGIERNRFEIFCDPLTRTIAVGYGAFGSALRRYGDMVVRKAQKRNRR